MKVGFIGCGKLGLMVALTIESKGHQVKGFDISEDPETYLRAREIPFTEKHSDVLLKHTTMEMVDLETLCDWADIIFMAPQTPHDPEFEGATPLPKSRADFNYMYLVDCVKAVDACLKVPKTCVIISTVLPGTLHRMVLPVIGENFRLVYSPQFIAMGTVYEDFTNPEFWLIGTHDPLATGLLQYFYSTIAQRPIVDTDIKTAEGIKVLYNTFITAKTVLANLYGEMADRCGMNVDDIFKAVSFSTRRLLSPKYMHAGMGDGGGCHPRDNIALSWLARKTGMSFDFFESLMTAREKHCEFLADVIEEHHWQAWDLPIVILGRSFKPETNIETGSPAALLSNILRSRGRAHAFEEDCRIDTPHLVFIGCQHERYKQYKFPAGSIVIDPFRYLPEQDGVKLVQIGKPRDTHRDNRVSQPVKRA